MRYFVTLLFATLFAIAATAHQPVERATYHYATHQDTELYLDVYSTPCSEARPCMIFAFGGGFVGGERDNKYYQAYFNHLAEHGIVVVSIDYRLGLKNLPADLDIKGMIATMNNAVNIAVEDLYAATNYLIANASIWNIDASKIMISGSSAGAITVLQAEWLRSVGGERAKVLPEGFRYAAVVSCAGALFSVSGAPKFGDDIAPIMLFHGTSDGNVPYNKSSIFGVGFYGSKYILKQLRKHNSPYYFYSEEYADHSLAVLPFMDKLDLIMQFIDDFVIADRAYQQECYTINPATPKRPTRFKVKDYLKNNYAK